MKSSTLALSLSLSFGLLVGCGALKSSSNGQRGDKGSDGGRGQDGAPGQAGPAGKDGAAGTNGIDGRDGAKGAQGEQGLRGLTGSSAIVRKDLAAAGTCLEDQLVFITDSSQFYRCVAGVWTLLNIKGDKGEQGATGAQGATGSTGATGAVGPAGAQGDVGATGAAGPQGAAGPAGLNGKNFSIQAAQDDLPCNTDNLGALVYFTNLSAFAECTAGGWSYFAVKSAAAKIDTIIGEWQSACVQQSEAITNADGSLVWANSLVRYTARVSSGVLALQKDVYKKYFKSLADLTGDFCGSADRLVKSDISSFNIVAFDGSRLDTRYNAMAFDTLVELVNGKMTLNGVDIYLNDPRYGIWTDTYNPAVNSRRSTAFGVTFTKTVAPVAATAPSP